MRILSQRVATCLAALYLAASLGAAEYAVLQTGARILADRVERSGGQVVLYTANGGRIGLPADAVVRMEPAESGPAAELEPAPSKPVGTNEKPTLGELILELAERERVHPDLIHSVIAAESAGDPSAVSHAGAIGLMQLMPETAAELAVDPYQADQNVRGGARYLREMLERYAGRDDQLVLALAAYNAGPGAVDRYNGIPPYAETRAYVRRVLERFLRLTEISD